MSLLEATLRTIGVLGEPGPTERIGEAVPMPIRHFGQVTFDESAFWAPAEPGLRIEWAAIRRIAFGYRGLGWRSWDYEFWAFQSSERLEALWVHIVDPPLDGSHPEWMALSEESDRFCDEVRRRFDVQPIPPMAEWVDRKMFHRAYTVWPAEEIGKPLYHTVKRRWWSWSGYLVHANP